jgi:hypothetical protein
MRSGSSSQAPRKKRHHIQVKKSSELQGCIETRRADQNLPTYVDDTIEFNSDDTLQPFLNPAILEEWQRTMKQAGNLKP